MVGRTLNVSFPTGLHTEKRNKLLLNLRDKDPKECCVDLLVSELGRPIPCGPLPAGIDQN